jgi:hypothetical protein
MKSGKRKLIRKPGTQEWITEIKRGGQSAPPAAAWFLTSQFAISNAKEVVKPEILNGVE